MKNIKPYAALFIGARLCLTDSRLKNCCSIPWTIGFTIYIGLMVVTVAMYSNMVAVIPINPTLGMFNKLMFILSLITVFLTISLSAMLLSSLIVLLASGSYHCEIAKTVLLDFGIDLPNEVRFSKEFQKSFQREITRLAVIISIMAISVFFSSFPILGILAVLLVAWMLAFPYFDNALEIAGLSSAQSFCFCKIHPFVLIVFGLMMLPFWFIPFAPIFITPFASAGAAWFVSTSATLHEVIKSIRDQGYK